MDENQFRVLIRTLEQMQRALTRFVEVMEEREMANRRAIHDIGSSITYLRGLSVDIARKLDA